MSATSVLFKEGFVKWLRTRGLLMVLAVALIPPALTGAWVFTHDADIAAVALDWEPANPRQGQNITFTAQIENVHGTAVGAFDTTIRVGFYERTERGVRWQDLHNETIRIDDGLAPGEVRAVTTQWRAQPGNHLVEVWADWFDPEISEIEKLNNYRHAQVQVAYEAVRPDIAAPPPADNATGNETGANAALFIDDVTWEPEQIFFQDTIDYTVTVRNDGPDDVDEATVTFQLYRLLPTGETRRIANEEQVVPIEAGTTPTVSFSYPNIDIGQYAVAFFLDADTAPGATDDSDTVLIQQFEVQRRIIFEEPVERATAKAFYRDDILLPLHFTLLVPLIGLFFAGGVLFDERQRGNLVYLLTRPVPRWSIPLARFASGFLVALIAVLVGVLATFLIIMGMPQEAPGFLWWPLVFAVLVLFLYSAVFTFVGVVSDRPYLIGLLYILGFESLVLAGRRIMINDQFIVQEWVLNFSLMYWVETAFRGWDPEAGTMLPVGDEAIRAFIVIIVIGVVALIGAGIAATRRQFPE